MSGGVSSIPWKGGVTVNHDLLANILIALILLIGTLFGVVICLRHPKAALAVALFAALFSPTLVVLTGIRELSLLDDALVLFCAIYLPGRRLMSGDKLRQFPGQWLFLGVAAAGAASSVMQQVPLATASTGGFLLLKGPILGFAAAQLDWVAADYALFRRLVVGFTIFLLASAGVNILMPDSWANVVASTRTVDYRYSLPSLIGPFTHPSFLGQLLGLCVVALIVLNKQGQRTWPLALLAAAAAFLTFRRKTWISIPLAVLAVLGLRRRLVALIMVIPAAALITASLWTPVQAVVTSTYQDYFVRSTEVPRVLLYKGAVEISERYFPLGAGFGRWGSEPAIRDYSPEYVSRGFESVYGFERNSTAESNFARDKFWPIPLGETGVVGLVCYLGALLAIARAFRRSLRVEASLPRALGLVGGGWFVMLMTESIAAPVFTGPPIFPWLFVLAGITAAVSQLHEELPHSEPSAVAAGTDGRNTSNVGHRGRLTAARPRSPAGGHSRGSSDPQPLPRASSARVDDT
jgi:hypothetical protein